MSEVSNNSNTVLSEMERRLMISILENIPEAKTKKITSTIEALRSGYTTFYPPTSLENEKSGITCIVLQEILEMFVDLKNIVGSYTSSQKSEWSDEDKENWKEYGVIRQFSLGSEDESWMNSYCIFLFDLGQFRTIRKDFESSGNLSTPLFGTYSDMLDKFRARSYDGDLRPEDIAFIVDPELKYENNGRYS